MKAEVGGQLETVPTSPAAPSPPAPPLSAPLARQLPSPRNFALLSSPWPDLFPCHIHCHLLWEGPLASRVSLSSFHPSASDAQRESWTWRTEPHIVQVLGRAPTWLHMLSPGIPVPLLSSPVSEMLYCHGAISSLSYPRVKHIVGI